MTKKGLEKLNKEYENLINTKRPQIVEKIAKARAEGDLSENAAYHSAREEQSFIEGKILELDQVIKNVVIQDSKIDGTVKVGSVVKIKIKESEEEFSIVSPMEANPTEKKISHESPLGSALLGKRVGDEIKVTVPMGDITYKIVHIK